MVLYQKGKTPFVLRFLPVFFNPGVWVLSGMGTGLFYFAGMEKPPVSNGMYIGVGIIALLIYIILHSHWITVATKLVLIEIVPSGLRMQQIKYDELHEVIIAADKLNLDVITRYRRNSPSQYELNISDKDETHSFSVMGGEELIGEMLGKISEQKIIELRANENDFLKRYKSNINSSGARIVKLFGYGVRVAVVVGIIMAGYTAYRSYADGGYVSELVNAIQAYQNQQSDIENSSDTNQLLAEFPKKWFPLFESDDDLVRQQICGSEMYIEIIGRDGSYIWSEHGYQDLWEAAIMNFANDAENKYVLTVQFEGSDPREIAILIIDKAAMVYTIDDKTYTPSPDSFVIENDTEECL